MPLTFKQLEIGPIINRQPRAPGYLSTNNVRASRAPLRRQTSPSPISSTSAPSFPYVHSDSSVSSSPSNQCSRTLVSGSTVSFQLTGGQGAALVTKHQTYREDIQRTGTFEKYAKQHHASWVAFARETGHGDDINPVIVTGVDRTRDFAMMSYSNDDHEMTSEFTTSVLEAAPTSAWGTWHSTGVVFTNCGPQLCCPPPSTRTAQLTPSGNKNTESGSDEYNQSVFVRYFTVRKRLGIPKVIKAGAGPHDLGTGGREDGELLETGARSPSDPGSDAASSWYSDEDDDRSSVTSIESESGTVTHNTTPVRSCLPLTVRFFQF